MYNTFYIVGDVGVVATQAGGCILVDAEDLEYLKGWVWHIRSGRGSKSYATGKPAEQPTGELVSMHRLLLGIPKYDPRVVDHINGCSTDNRKCNLRAVSQQKNTWNIAVSRNNRWGYRGVTKTATGRFAALIRVGAGKRYLGCFPTAEEAGAAYLRAWHLRDAVDSGSEPHLPKLRKLAKSGYKGVDKLEEGKFRARIRRGGKNHTLGVFPTAQQAGAAYLAAVKERQIQPR